MLAVVVALSIAYWYISIPVLVLTAIAVGVTVHRHHVQREHGAVPTAPVAVAPVAVAPAAFVPAAASPAAVRQSLPTVQDSPRKPTLTVPADTFKVGSLVHLEKDGTRATYFVDHGRTPDEIVLKRVTSTPTTPDA